MKKIIETHCIICGTKLKENSVCEKCGYRSKLPNDSSGAFTYFLRNYKDKIKEGILDEAYKKSRIFVLRKLFSIVLTGSIAVAGTAATYEVIETNKVRKQVEDVVNNKSESPYNYSFNIEPTNSKTEELEVIKLEPLGKLKANTTINLYEGYKIDDLLELEDDAKINEYYLNEETSELSFTLQKSKRIETYIEIVNIVKPLITNIQDNISIDVAKRYNIKDYLELEDGAELETHVDFNNQMFLLTATKDDRIETYEIPAEITCSDSAAAEGGFPSKWEQYAYDYQSAIIPGFHDDWDGEFFEFYGDGTGLYTFPRGGFVEPFYYEDGLITWPAPREDASYNEYVTYDTETQTLYIKDNYKNTRYCRRVN